MKRLLIIGMFMFTVILSACTTAETPNQNNPTIDESELIELTLEELSAFDGRNGRKAYIAVQGFIYDVTDSPYWRNGNHNGHQAGQDLTDVIINQSPHGIGNLARVPRIGILVDE